MEEKKKVKGAKEFKAIFFLLVFIFAFLYFADVTGYYDKNISKSSVLTKEAILEFEKDVADGKAVDIKDYVKGNTKDYTNTYSDLGYKVSSTIDAILNDGVGYLVKILEALFG